MRRWNFIASAVAMAIVLACLFGVVAVAAPEQEPGLPEECQPSDVRDLFEAFGQAVNAGEKEAGLNLIAASPEQNGFSVGSPESKGNLLLSRKPGTIFAFFARKARAGVGLRLLGADVKPLDARRLVSGPYRRPQEGPSADDAVAGVSFELKMSGERGGLRQPSGKAGINCSSGQFYVWALDLGEPVDKADKGVRVCANKPRVRAARPFRKPLMC